VATSPPAEGDKDLVPKSRKGAQTRARILDAAKEVFEESGFLEARISDIAERAGLSHGAFYHYFESKEQIFRELAALLDEELSAPLGDVILAPDSTASPAARLREALHRHFVAYEAEAKMMGVIEQVSRYDDHVDAMRTERHERNRRQIADSIRQLQLRGLADPELDPVIAASALGALTWRFAEMWLVQGLVTCTIDEGVDQVTRIFVNALGLKDDRIDDPIDV